MQLKLDWLGNWLGDWRGGLEFLTREETLRRLAAGVNIVLVLLLAAQLAELTWRWVPPPPAAPPAPGVVPFAPGGTSASAQAGARAGGAAQGAEGDVARLHLFGTKPAAPPRTSRPAPAAMPETRLQLILRGVFASDDPALAGAIVAERSGKEAFYNVGDTLPGGAVLKEVYPDRIVLQRSGRLETLRMPKEPVSGAPSSGARSPAARDSGPRARHAAGPRPSLREYRDMVLQDPQQFADKVRLRPRMQGGRMQGYEVRPGRDAQFLSQFGLEPGDVVTAVNGIPLDSPARGLSVLRDLARAQQVQLEVVRNGVPQTIELDLTR